MRSRKIKLSKTFDYATSCSSENNLVVIEKVYDEFIKLLELEGGLLLNSDQKKSLQNIMWINGKLNINILAKPIPILCKEVDLIEDCSEKTQFLIVEEQGVGRRTPFFRRRNSLQYYQFIKLKIFMMQKVFQIKY